MPPSNEPHDQRSEDHHVYLSIASLKDRLLEASSIQAVVDEAASATHDILGYPIVNIFLLSKTGKLERVGHFSSADLQPAVTNATDEVFERGESPITKVLGPTPSSRYGTPCWDTHPWSDPADASRLNRYSNLFGPITSYIRIPLNGSSQSYGVLEVLNCSYSQSPPELPTAPADLDRHLCRLITIGLVVSGQITSLRAARSADVLSNITSNLVSTRFTPEALPHSLGPLFDDILHCLVQLSDYRAAVLHVLTDNVLSVTGKYADPDVDWGTWINNPIPVGEYLAGLAVAQDEDQFVYDIPAHRHLFSNLLWLETNDICTCGSIRVRARGVILGTLSVYTGFEYRYSALDKNLLSTVADSVGFFLDRLKAERLRSDAENELQKVHTELRDEQQRRIRSAGHVAFGSAIDELKHDYKQSFQTILLLLSEYHSTQSSTKIGHIISKIETTAEEALDRAEKELQIDQDGLTVIDINRRIKRLATLHSTALAEDNIQIVLDLHDIPDIEMMESEFSELINNPLSNSIRAVRDAGRTDGRIQIETLLSKIKSKNYIELRITDNGVGIDKAVLPHIFERHFTTNESRRGTGLGLAFVRSVATRYGGSVLCESVVGQGTTLTIRLPESRVKA